MASSRLQLDELAGGPGLRHQQVLTPYLSWTTGKDPPGTNNIFLVNAPEGQFALSSSRQIEAASRPEHPTTRRI